MQIAWLGSAASRMEADKDRVRGGPLRAAGVAKGDRRLDKVTHPPPTLLNTEAASPGAGTTLHALCRPVNSRWVASGQEQPP